MPQMARKERIMFINKTVTNKYKTNELAIFLTLPLRKETITKNALLPKVLSRGTKKRAWFR